LRNPIGNVRLITHLLLEAQNDLSQLQCLSLLNDINAQTNHMLSLLDELLDVTMIEAGKLNLQLQPVDLGRFLTEVVQRHAMMAGPKGRR